MHTQARVIEAAPGLGAKIQRGLLTLGRWGTKGLTHGRGFGRYIERLGSVFSPNNILLLEIFGTRRLVVPTYDAYWLGPLLSGQEYEPEVGKLLALVLDEDSAFIDCGANIGYWSVMASTKISRPERIVAVEASEHLYDLLMRNRAANDDRFVCVHAAVWDEPQRVLTMASDRQRHSWGSVDAAVRSRLTQVGFSEHAVGSTTVDEILNQLGDPALVVIKLDVEGAEPRALAGARRALERNHLLVYEEHGRETEAGFSDSLVTEHGLDLFGYGPDLELRHFDVEQVRTGRPHRAQGYNFFACRPGSPVHSTLMRETGAGA